VLGAGSSFVRAAAVSAVVVAIALAAGGCGGGGGGTGTIKTDGGNDRPPTCSAASNPGAGVGM